MLLVIDEVLSAKERLQARTLLAQARWQSGLHSAGAQAAQVKNNQQLDETEPQLEALRALVLGSLARSPTFFSAALPRQILPPQFNRHAGAHNAYGPHVDSALFPQAGGYLRSDVSASLFLSDPGDYDGGSLRIMDSFGSHAIKLPAGSLVLYPSSTVHEVEPVTRGERLVCFMFIQSLVASAERRRLLYDMDMSLLQLRAQLGEVPSLVQLTGTYHNLLRQWSQT